MANCASGTFKSLAAPFSASAPWTAGMSKSYTQPGFLQTIQTWQDFQFIRSLSVCSRNSYSYSFTQKMCTGIQKDYIDPWMLQQSQYLLQRDFRDCHLSWGFSGSVLYSQRRAIHLQLAAVKRLLQAQSCAHAAHHAASTKLGME